MSQNEVGSDRNAQDEQVAAAEGITRGQLSESARNTPLGKLLAAGAMGGDYADALGGFIQNQWDLHNALKEMGVNIKREREDEEDPRSASTETCAAKE